MSGVNQSKTLLFEVKSTIGMKNNLRIDRLGSDLATNTFWMGHITYI